MHLRPQVGAMPILLKLLAVTRTVSDALVAVTFSARQHIAYMLSALYVITRPSVRPSHG